MDLNAITESWASDGMEGIKRRRAMESALAGGSYPGCALHAGGAGYALIARCVHG